MSGSDRPVPVWSEFGEYEQSADAAAAAAQKEQKQRLLYSVMVTNYTNSEYLNNRMPLRKLSLIRMSYTPSFAQIDVQELKMNLFQFIS